MLVLSRKVGESIDIGGNIQLQVLEVRGRRVRLGVAAPTNVPVRRTELAIPELAEVAMTRQDVVAPAYHRKAK